jgi:hypothetical protein
MNTKVSELNVNLRVDNNVVRLVSPGTADGVAILKRYVDGEKGRRGKRKVMSGDESACLGAAVCFDSFPPSNHSDVKFAHFIFSIFLYQTSLELHDRSRSRSQLCILSPFEVQYSAARE